MLTNILHVNAYMYVQSGCSGNDDNDVVIPFLPCSDRQLADSPCFLMEQLGTKHRVWFQQFGTTFVPYHFLNFSEISMLYEIFQSLYLLQVGLLC